VRRADNLTTFMCRLSKNLGASTSWDPKGLSRPVMGLLYLTCTIDVLTLYISFVLTSHEDGDLPLEHVVGLKFSTKYNSKCAYVAYELFLVTSLATLVT
jgi:hypothetical protein